MAELPQIIPNTAPMLPEALNEVGAESWHRLWTHAHWLNPTTDLNMVLRYCRYLDLSAQLQAVVDAEGVTTTSTKGTTMTHPALRELREVDTAIVRMEKELGLSPKSRTAVGAAEMQGRRNLTVLSILETLNGGDDY